MPLSICSCSSEWSRVTCSNSLAAQAVEARVADVRDRDLVVVEQRRRPASCPCRRTAAGSAPPGRSRCWPWRSARAAGARRAARPVAGSIVRRAAPASRLLQLGGDHRGRHAARHLAGVVAAHAVGEHHQARSTRRRRCESSLCERTMPGSVRLAISSAWLRFMFFQRLMSTLAGLRHAGAPRRAAPAANSSPVWKRCVGILRERTVEEGDECRAAASGLKSQDVRRRLVGDLEHELRHRLALERQPAAEQLVERHAQREEVGAPVDLLAGELLGRHVGRRAEHHAGLGLATSR